ncbi:MAG: hypothetical protein ACK5EK_02515 [Flavobacteriia bacterium]|jgi:hypothetical protein
MKIFIMAFTAILFTSCGIQKEVSGSNSSATDAEQSTDDTMIVGIVRMNPKGCPLYLDANENGEAITMYPVNLDDKFKKDGIRLKFSYTPSRAMQPEDCNVTKVVALENVTQLR